MGRRNHSSHLGDKDHTHFTPFASYVPNGKRELKEEGKPACTDLWKVFYDNGIESSWSWSLAIAESLRCYLDSKSCHIQHCTSEVRGFHWLISYCILSLHGVRKVNAHEYLQESCKFKSVFLGPKLKS